MEDKTIKCLNRGDIGDQMKSLKLSKMSQRINMYTYLNITNNTIMCRNDEYAIEDLCKDGDPSSKTCQLNSGVTIDL